MLKPKKAAPAVKTGKATPPVAYGHNWVTGSNPANGWAWATANAVAMHATFTNNGANNGNHVTVNPIVGNLQITNAGTVLGSFGANKVTAGQKTYSVTYPHSNTVHATLHGKTVQMGQRQAILSAIIHGVPTTLANGNLCYKTVSRAYGNILAFVKRYGVQQKYNGVLAMALAGKSSYKSKGVATPLVTITVGTPATQ
tara:strand:+ start:101 stop:694 length:594 start_codon:yes stop_codon:yes gene_type:complete